MTRKAFQRALKFAQAYLGWLGEGGKPVSRELAQARADICLSCPLNQKLETALHRTVTAAIKTQIELKNQMKLSVEGEEKLHICAGCDCVLKLKIHVPMSFVKATTDREELAEQCWIRQEWELNL